MNAVILYTAGDTAALRFARQNLLDRGITVVDRCAPDVTHLLLPVPSFEADGRIKGGGVLEHILSDLPDRVHIIGGNLQHPALAGHPTTDLLKDPLYLAQNAAITADCAIRTAGALLPVVFKDCPILVIGWGRIGKCLAAKLQAMGARVCVAARKQSDLAVLRALEYGTEDTCALGPSLMRYRVILNTVPYPVLDQKQCKHCQPGCIKIDLASSQGILDSDVIWARGLPNKDAPESSGLLIAGTVVGLLSKKEALL